MYSICKWYWNMMLALQEHYFKRKYSNRTPKIYYDQRHRVYVNPKIISERGCAEYVSSESVGEWVFYAYKINGTETHAHSITAVFIEAYNNSETFSISEEHKEQYSKQELDMIYKLVKQGKDDRLLTDNPKRYNSATPFPDADK